MIKSVH